MAQLCYSPSPPCLHQGKASFGCHDADGGGDPIPILAVRVLAQARGADAERVMSPPPNS